QPKQESPYPGRYGEVFLQQQRQQKYGGKQAQVDQTGQLDVAEDGAIEIGDVSEEELTPPFAEVRFEIEEMARYPPSSLAFEDLLVGNLFVEHDDIPGKEDFYPLVKQSQFQLPVEST